MQEPTFDAAHAVRFDLTRGAVADASDERVVLVPVAGLTDLVRSAERPVVAALGGSVGRALGQRAADRLGGAESVASSSVETVLAHLAGEFAVAGFCALSFERWGRALVVVLDEAAVADVAFAEAMVATAITAACGRDVACASLGQPSDPKPDGGVAGARLRLFVGREASVQRVRAWVSEGLPFGIAVARLQSGGDA